MKTLKTLALTALLAVGTSAYAQFANSSSSAPAATSQDGWSTLYVQWNPGSVSCDEKGAKNQSFTGLSLGYNKAFAISQKTPLFVEAGLGLQYSFYSENDEDEKLKFSMFSAKVPVNLAYAWQIPNSSITLIPHAGIHFRFNISGKEKWEGYNEYEDETETDETNLFDKKEMKGEPWKRFQMGWQIGVNARFSDKFLVGISYEKDFSEIAKKIKIGQANITLGYCF